MRAACDALAELAPLGARPAGAASPQFPWLVGFDTARAARAQTIDQSLELRRLESKNRIQRLGYRLSDIHRSCFQFSRHELSVLPGHSRVGRVKGRSSVSLCLRVMPARQ